MSPQCFTGPPWVKLNAHKSQKLSIRFGKRLNYMYYRAVSKLPVTLLISSWLHFFVENAKSEYIKGRWAPAANNVISIKCKNLGRHFRGDRRNPGTIYVWKAWLTDTAPSNGLTSLSAKVSAGALVTNLRNHEYREPLWTGIEANII